MYILLILNEYLNITIQNDFKLGETLNLPPVLFFTSSRVVSLAISINNISLVYLSKEKTAISVISKSTTAFPVRGKVQLDNILCSPFLAVCSIVTTTLLAPFTKSIAPPIPFTILPGMIQLARSPFSATYNPPSILRSICLPLIIAKLYELEKKLPPGRTVTVYLPALIRSGSTNNSLGKGPNPNIPFSLYKVI
jgi:hypothetical protein